MTIYNGMLSQQLTGEDYVRKVREERTKLYEKIPHEDIKEFPFTKMVMTKKGDYIRNFKHHWYLQNLPLESGIVYTTGATMSTNPKRIQLLKTGSNYAQTLFGKITPRKNESFTFIAVDSTGETKLVFQGIYEGGTNTHNFLVIDEKLGTLTAASDLTGNTIFAQKSYTSFPEGSGLPSGRFETPVEVFNYSQIVMEAFSVTGSELADLDIFDESKYNRYVKQTLRSFNNQIEQILRFGVRHQDTETSYDGSTGQRTFCGGLEYFMRLLNPQNVINIRKMTAEQQSNLGFNASGVTWLEGGYDFLKCLLTYVGRTSVRRKTLIASIDVIKNINDMLESMSNVMVEPRVKNEWGFEVTRLITPLCDLDLLVDYQATMNDGLRGMAWIISPDVIEYRPRLYRDITPIKSLKDLPKNVENGFTWRDAVKEGIFVDFSLEINYTDGCAIIYNWGRDFGVAQ